MVVEVVEMEEWATDVVVDGVMDHWTTILLWTCLWTAITAEDVPLLPVTHHPIPSTQAKRPSAGPRGILFKRYSLVPSYDMKGKILIILLSLRLVPPCRF